MPVSTDQPKTVLSFGELLWDLLPSGPVLGGAPANLAYRLSALGQRALLVSRLGRDSLGQSAFDHIARLGMDTSYLQWDQRLPTGTVQVELDVRGNPDFTIVPGVAYDQIDCTEALLTAARAADCVCFGTLAQRSTVNRHTLRQILAVAGRALKFLDINLRKGCYTQETIADSLAQADFLKINEQELQYIAQLFQFEEADIPTTAAHILRRWELSHCLITLGERGAFVLRHEGEAIYAPGYEVKLADTCGSGDACAAGFLHGLLAGDPLNRCLQWGNALGALVATQHGATEPVSREALATFLKNPPARIVDPRLARHLSV